MIERWPSRAILCTQFFEVFWWSTASVSHGRRLCSHGIRLLIFVYLFWDKTTHKWILTCTRPGIFTLFCSFGLLTDKSPTHRKHLIHSKYSRNISELNKWVILDYACVWVGKEWEAKIAKVTSFTRSCARIWCTCEMFDIYEQQGHVFPL
jgi:hypothetical protein